MTVQFLAPWIALLWALADRHVPTENLPNTVHCSESPWLTAAPSSTVDFLPRLTSASMLKPLPYRNTGMRTGIYYLQKAYSQLDGASSPLSGYLRHNQTICIPNLSPHNRTCNPSSVHTPPSCRLRLPGDHSFQRARSVCARNLRTWSHQR